MTADELARSITTSAETLRARLGPRRPRIAVVLGSGWGPFAQAAAAVQGAVQVPYAELPAFPRLAIGGHAGVLSAACVGGQDLIVLAGRKHSYESGQADGMKGAIRTLAAVGVQVLVQTNAAGSLDAAMPPGTVMLIEDHLNLVQMSPLVGEAGDSRFVDMGQAYCPRLRAQAQAAAQAQRGTALASGVYAWVLGPQFETPAEIRMIKALGAQAVGMSTVPETILARHAGMRVLALSMMTNMAAGMSSEVLSHGHTMANAQAASDAAVALLTAIVSGLELPA
jgi:purine-nucleoside phosphorylase